MSQVAARRGAIRIGTRASRLARWQAEWVARRIQDHDPDIQVELVEIRTLGDQDRESPLTSLGGQGVFTKEIQRAVIAGAVDVAVHSLKDLPSGRPDGLTLAAVPVREEIADALIAPRFGTLERLPEGATIGTGSVRRRSQLLSLRPDLNVVGLRGNIETRLNQALNGTLDAVVLAFAGLNRLNLAGHVTDRLAPPRMLPAVGQGALGLECRDDDADALARLRLLEDAETHHAVRAERALMAVLEGGCSIPLGAWARRVGAEIALDAVVVDPDGRERIEAARSGPFDQPEELGRAVAQELLDRGAGRVLASQETANPNHQDP